MTLTTTPIFPPSSPDISVAFRSGSALSRSAFAAPSFTFGFGEFFIRCTSVLMASRECAAAAAYKPCLLGVVPPFFFRILCVSAIKKSTV